MSTITRERAELKSFITGFLSDPMHDDQSAKSMTAEVFRIALASLEAEAVMYVMAGEDFDSDATSVSKAVVDSWVEEWNQVGDRSFRTVPLYTAPPAPVSVPDEREAFNTWNNDTDCPLAGRDAKTAAWLAWCRRAAMLQCADGNAPVSPDGWVLVPVEPTTNQWAAGMQAFDSGVDKVTRVYKAMLAAAPQQEVKPCT